MDFESIPKCSRVCSRSGRPLNVGETCFSALLEGHDGRIVRSDYAAEAWPPSSKVRILGWWRFLIPERSEKRLRLAPNDILIELFDKWVFEPSYAEELYILTLLLLRRRVFRYENDTGFPKEKELLLVYSPRREMTYSVPVVPLTDERISKIQNELAELLYSGDPPDGADESEVDVSENIRNIG